MHADVYDEFVRRVVARAQTAKLGDPFETDTDQGPQVSEEQMKKILGYISLGKEQGASLLTGGAQHGSHGYWVQPTIFADVDDEMAIAKEEIFGPVMSIMKYDDYDDVVRRANASEYGLAAGVWTTSLDRANTLSRALRVGTVRARRAARARAALGPSCPPHARAAAHAAAPPAAMRGARPSQVWVNTYNQFDAAAPFGGYKQSGIGRDKGEYALAQYTETKLVQMPLKQPAWK